MRRSVGFGGRDAAFDSHSCLSRHESDTDFEPGAARWKNSLYGRISPQIWESAHENIHWVQYIGTGFGSFLNRLRSERDRHIVLALRQCSGSAKRISDRISSTVLEPIFDYDSILSKVLKSRAPAEPIEWAVSYDLLERSVYFADASKHWDEDSDLLGRVAGRLLCGDGDFGDALSNCQSQSAFAVAWPVFDQPISTEQLLEAQAVLFEFFFLATFGHSEEEQSKRFDALQSTSYFSPSHYAVRELYKASSDAEFLAAMQGAGARSFWVTVIICIDLALDIYFPVGPASVDVTSVDWCPPLRFTKLIEAVKTTALIPLDAIDDQLWTNSREVFFYYRQRLKSAAGLRASTDHDFVLVGDYAEFDAVSRMRFQPEGELRPLMKDISLYEVVSKIQELLHEKKKDGIAFLHDPILNLSHTNAPSFSNYFDENDFRLAHLSVPLNISYGNGTIGRNMSLPVLAAQAAHSAFGTYPLYALAFESGELKVAPWQMDASVNMSGEPLPRFFAAMLQKSIDKVNEQTGLISKVVWSPGDRIMLGKERETTINSLESIGSDWSTYLRIAQVEGHMPVTIELKEDFFRNHAQVDPSALDLLKSKVVVCYLQQQYLLTDGESIGLKVHLIDEPERLIRLGIMAPCRVQLSGKLMSRAFRDDYGPWVNSIGNMPLSILLDADADEIIETLVPAWEWLAWQPLRVEHAVDSVAMIAYPIGARNVPEFGLFRPCTPDNEDTVRHSLGLFAFPAMVKELGVPIFGMSEEQRSHEWKAPDFLEWTIRRYYNDTACFEAITRRSE